MRVYFAILLCAALTQLSCTVVATPVPQGVRMPDEPTLDATMFRERDYLPETTGEQASTLVGRVLTYCTGEWSLGSLRFAATPPASDAEYLRATRGAVAPTDLERVPAFKRLGPVGPNELLFVLAQDVIRYWQDPAELDGATLRRLAISKRDCRLFVIGQAYVTAVIKELYVKAGVDEPTGPLISYGGTTYMRNGKPSFGRGVGVVLFPFNEGTNFSALTLTAAVNTPSLNPGSILTGGQTKAEFDFAAAALGIPMDADVLTNMAFRSVASPSYSQVQELLRGLRTFAAENNHSPSITMSVWNSFLCRFCPRYPFCLEKVACQ
jgi:hypothetical protein